MNHDGWEWECPKCGDELFAWRKADIRRQVEEHRARHTDLADGSR